MKLNDNTHIKLGIAVPCRDTVHSLFTYSLAELIQFNAKENIKTKLYMLSGSLIANQRHKLAKMCIEDGCTHILWLDSDMMFPPTLAASLLSHKKPIVACNYSTRTEPRKSVAYYKIGEWENWMNSKNQTEALTIIEAIGLGCMLCETNVFTGMFPPYFEVQYDENLKEWIGEDFYFCKKLNDQGYKILVDNKLSLEVSHIGIIAYTNAGLI